uniref:Uncharacterized protein n=1 Tax=Oryza brachyantha TaxID=4533 RepID=J3LFN5_ORYBR
MEWQGEGTDLDDDMGLFALFGDRGGDDGARLVTSESVFACRAISGAARRDGRDSGGGVEPGDGEAQSATGLEPLPWYYHYTRGFQVGREGFSFTNFGAVRRDCVGRVLGDWWLATGETDEKKGYGPGYSFELVPWTGGAERPTALKACSEPWPQ